MKLGQDFLRAPLFSLVIVIQLGFHIHLHFQSYPLQKTNGQTSDLAKEVEDHKERKLLSFFPPYKC